MQEATPEPAYFDEARFEPFERRVRRCDNLTREIWETIQGAKTQNNGKAGVSWQGIPMRKNPFDMTLYSMLIWELKPRTIIELGTFSGASALWMADIASSFNLNPRIISVDKSLGRVQVKDPRIEFVEYNVYEFDVRPFPVPLQDLPHPWLVCEDTHKNTIPLLEYFDRLLIRGDYLIVEDTCHLPLLDVLEQFMEKHGSHYRVDTNYVDNFGYNNTGNWNSYLACVKDPDTDR